MPFVKDTSYRDKPFSAQTRYGEFYTYSKVKDLAEKCGLYNDEIIRCRTIGILQSINGRFYLTDIDSPTKLSEPLVQVSMVFLKSPPQSTVMPYPVQVFGTMQWKKRPVIFAKIMQMMTIAMAIRLGDTMSSVTNLHLARHDDCTEDIK